MADPLPAPIARLIEEFARLPTIGPKTAQRLAFFLLRAQPSQVATLGAAVSGLRHGITTCRRCLNYADHDPCLICSDTSRATSLLCVVEDPLDLLAVERSGGYRGLYHVLHGAISPLDGIGPDDIKIRELVRRVEADGTGEVIVATNASIEGDATAMEIRQRLTGTGVRITRLARGLATGGDIEYVDAATIAQALEGRREL